MARSLTAPAALAVPAALAFMAACTGGNGTRENPSAMNPLAEQYVKLVLRVGVHDAGYVDAYYGPAEWAGEADAAPGTLPELREEGERLLAALGEVALPSGADEMARLRYGYLTRQLESVVTRIDLIEGA